MFDNFAKEKLDFLKKKDKSRKGSIDKDILNLAKEINSKKDYYTTSSCAGRIVLLEMKSRKKGECIWLFAEHDKVEFNEIFNSLKNYNGKNEVWLKQQPLILHVACRDLDAAKKFLDSARKIFRRAGIIGLSGRKVMLEVIGSEHLETLIKRKNIMPDEKYLKELIKAANHNFGENKKKTEKFYKSIRSL